MFTIAERLRPNRTFTDFFVTLSFAVLLIWFGLMNISGASAPVVERWLAGHAFLNSLLEHKKYIMWGLGGLQALSGLLIVLYSVPDRIKRLAYWPSDRVTAKVAIFGNKKGTHAGAPSVG